MNSHVFEVDSHDWQALMVGGYEVKGMLADREMLPLCRRELGEALAAIDGVLAEAVATGDQYRIDRCVKWASSFVQDLLAIVGGPGLHRE